MKTERTKLIQIFSVGLIFILVLVFAAVHDFSKRNKNIKQSSSVTNTTVAQSQSDNNPGASETTVSTVRLNGDDASPAEIQANLDKYASPFDAGTKTWLRQNASAALLAYLTGEGRQSFPALWPDDTSGSDANFQTAAIDASGVTRGDATSATIAVYWHSNDLPDTMHTRIALVTAHSTGGHWQITDVQL
jgi:hypothetical protein